MLLLPAVAEALAAHGVAHEVLECLPELADTAEFCAHYGFSLEHAANTILVTSKMDIPQVVMGGGNRSSKIVLSPAELLKLPGVEVVDGLATPREPAEVPVD